MDQERLFALIRSWRNEAALDLNIPRYRVMSDQRCRAIARSTADVAVAAWSYLLNKRSR